MSEFEKGKNECKKILQSIKDSGLEIVYIDTSLDVVILKEKELE